MEFKMFFLTTFVVCFFNIGSVHSMPEYSMDSGISKVDVNDPRDDYYSSGRVKSHSGAYYMPSRQDTLILSAPKGYSIFAAFRTLDLRPYSQDSVTLYADGQVGTNPLVYTNTGSGRNRIYDSREEKYTFFAKNGQLGVKFVTGYAYTTSGYKGFDMYYTVQANWTRCIPENFKCKNGQCIAKALKCDGHNHCGDRSDQRNCVAGFGVGKIIGVTFGVIFLIVAAACAIYIIRRRRSRTEVRTVINHPPPPTYSQPTQYPPPPPPYSYNQGAPNPGFR